MKAVRVTTQVDGIFNIAPLALPTAHRKGSVDPKARQARGEVPKVKHNLSRSNSLRTIVLADGKFMGLASHPGALLTFIVSGELTIDAATSQVVLEAGDVLLTDERSATGVAINARNQCRLVQISVSPDWPGPGAELQQPGTIIPRSGASPNLQRMYTGKDEKSYFSDLSELFPEKLGDWSAARPITGVRFMCWEDGSMDWHPVTINRLAIFLSGEMEAVVGGGDGATEIFRAGDICLGEDRTGEGHIDRARGSVHLAEIVVEAANLW